MSIEIKKLCVATDFSEQASRALSYGAELALRFDAELHLLHVLQDLGAAVVYPDYAACIELARRYFNRPDEAGAEAETKQVVGTVEKAIPAQELLRTMERRTTDQFDVLVLDAWRQRLNMVQAIRYGHPAEEICRYVRRHNIALLVLGTHGRTGLDHFLMGSVAERVVRISPCPVLTIGPRTPGCD